MRVFTCIAIILALAVVATEARQLTNEDYQGLFTGFVKKYNKEYTHDEFFNRFNIFKANYDKVRLHNKSNATFSMAINSFADLTAAEFKARYTGYKPELKRTLLGSRRNVFSYDVDAPLADSVDWRQKKAVTPVKNQGQCGSCWAFSTTGSVEGAVAIKSKTLVSFSEQQLVDCSSSYGNQGCNGGLMDNAFKYIIANGGLTTEDSYPYTGTQGSCKTSKSAGTITSFEDITAGDEKALMAAVQKGPVSIAIEADQSSFQLYSGGVMSATCGKSLDHGVLLVGYGTEPTTKQDYWIVKNSWGASWGEQGYIRLLRGIDQCGLADAASRPIA